jgi:disulfide oxidoreductase YuzD
VARAIEIKWLREPQEHDYPAAKSYLRLLYDKRTAVGHVEKLKRARMSKFKSKDIFRASQLPLLGVSNSHVKKDRRRIKAGETLSPLLLIRDEKNGKVVIADGYHRLCAVYSFDEDAVIPCKIA